MAGKDVVELGCGTGYFGAWVKRAGARRVVGVDVTPAQLETARRMNEEFGLGLEFLELLRVRFARQRHCLEDYVEAVGDVIGGFALRKRLHLFLAGFQ